MNPIDSMFAEKVLAWIEAALSVIPYANVILGVSLVLLLAAFIVGRFGEAMAKWRKDR